MHHATQYGSDGVYQFFGIPSAISGAAVKQGWGNDNPQGQPAFNSTGLVNGDRYSVAILTQGGSYGAPISNMLTSEARLLMPGGKISTDSPSGMLDRVTANGYVVTVHGWAYDPNATSQALKVVVNDNGALAAYGMTAAVRPDVNAAFKITGLHGYTLTMRLSRGIHTLCAYGINVGPGLNALLGCRTITLTGNPIGMFENATPLGNLVTVNGWAYDYDAPTQALKIVVYSDGAIAAYGPTTAERPDVNGVYKITGTHGYAIPFRLGTGVHRVCVYGINVGPGLNSTLSCRTVTLTGNPLGEFESAVVQGDTVTVKGWTYDYDAPIQPLKTVVYVDGALKAYGPTTVGRPDVNTDFKITGSHGYAMPFTLSTGVHQVCVYSINVGPGLNSTLGCKPVTVD
jgi:hypothetical protein